MKQVQIPENLYEMLVFYFLHSTAEERLYMPKIEQFIFDGLNAKEMSRSKREAFSAYLTAKNGDEREALRKKYLDLVGIHSDWRTETEKPDP